MPFPNLTQMLLDVVVALTENLLDLDAAQGVDAVKPPNARTLAALCFSPDDLPYENESRHLVGSNCDLPVTSISILSAISLPASWNWKAAAHGETYWKAIGQVESIFSWLLDLAGRRCTLDIGANPD